jgi:hypothetical protein
MSETQALPANVARYTSQIVAAYCERNGVNISDMEDVAVAISKAFVGIAAQFSATAVAQKSASTAERAEPQKTIRFLEERLNRSGYPGTAAVGAGGSATLAVPGGRDPAVQPAHPNLALEPEAAAAAASAYDQVLSELDGLSDLTTPRCREMIACKIIAAAEDGEDRVGRLKKAGKAGLAQNNVVSLAFVRAARSKPNERHRATAQAEEFGGRK